MTIGIVTAYKNGNDTEKASKMTEDDIVKLGEAYSAHAGLKLSTVSTYAACDGKWLGNLRDNRAGCTLLKARRVIQWFSDNWPADLAWPKDIPRPIPTKPEAA